MSEAAGEADAGERSSPREHFVNDMGILTAEKRKPCRTGREIRIPKTRLCGRGINRLTATSELSVLQQLVSCHEATELELVENVLDDNESQVMISDEGLEEVEDVGDALAIES